MRTIIFTDSEQENINRDTQGKLRA